MAQVIEAVYANGVFKPKDELALRESQRVRLIIEPLDEAPSGSGRSAAMLRLLAGIEQMLLPVRKRSPSYFICFPTLLLIADWLRVREHTGAPFRRRPTPPFFR